MTNSIKNLSIYRHKNKIILLNIKNHKWVKMAEALYNEKMCNPDKFEYSNAIVHAFQKFRAPFSGKIVHIFPEQSAVI